MHRCVVVLLLGSIVVSCKSNESPEPVFADTSDASLPFEGGADGSLDGSAPEPDAVSDGSSQQPDAVSDGSSQQPDAASPSDGSSQQPDAAAPSDGSSSADSAPAEDANPQFGDAAPCVPDCTSKACGDSDGCGQACVGPTMPCPGGGTCDALGVCAGGCVADCASKACYVNDGCGGRCLEPCLVDGGVALHAETLALPPTSEGLIDEARRNGTITDIQAAYYELLAETVPRLLPAEYQASVPALHPGSFIPRLMTNAFFDSLDAEQQAVVTALTAEPVDPGFMALPASALAHAGPAPVPPPPNTCASYFAAGANGEPAGGQQDGASVKSKYFEFIAIKPNAPSPDPSSTGVNARMRKWLDIAVAAEGPISRTYSWDPAAGPLPPPFAQYLDRVFEYYLSIGLKDPRPAKTDAGWVGGLPSIARHDGRIAVYVAGCDARPDAVAAVTGYIFAADSIALHDPWFRRVALPHEVFHLFESAYGVWFKRYPDLSLRRESWPFEAAAVAMEDVVAPSVQRWSGVKKAGAILSSEPPPGQNWYLPMNRFFACPEEAFHSVETNPKRCGSAPTRSPAQILYRGDYSKFVYFKFMMENRASFNMMNFWTHYAEKGGDPTTLVYPDDVAELNLAVLADVKGRAPYFRPEDRQVMAQLFPPMRAGDAPRPSDPTRYTATVFASEYNRQGKNKDWKLTSADPVYTEDKEQPFPEYPVNAGATHRWLIHLPPEAQAAIASQPWTESAEQHTVATPFSVVVKVDKGEENLILTIAPLDGPPSQPGQTVNFDNEGPADDLYPKPDPAGKTVVDCTGAWFAYEQKAWRVSNAYRWPVSNGPAPAHVLLTITNASTDLLGSDAAYRLGVSLPAKCFEQCANHYATEWVRQGCADLACQDCKPDSGCCPDKAQCLLDQADPTKLFFASAVQNKNSWVGYGDGLCKEICGGSSPTYGWTPTLPVCNGGDNAFLTPNESLGPLAGAFCTKTDCTTQPYAFVGVSEWPDMPGGLCTGCAGCLCMQLGVNYGEWCLLR
jgi:hypothetical protein